MIISLCGEMPLFGENQDGQQDTIPPDLASWGHSDTRLRCATRGYSWTLKTQPQKGWQEYSSAKNAKRHTMNKNPAVAAIKYVIEHPCDQAGKGD